MAIEAMDSSKPYFGYFSTTANYNNRGNNVDASAICFVQDTHQIYNRTVRFTGYDSNGADIRTTYIKNVAKSGSIVTVTWGDGSTSSFESGGSISRIEATDAVKRTVLFSNDSDTIYYDNDMKYDASNNLLEVGKVKLNGTQTAGCTMQYDASAECVKFVFS